MNQIEYCYCIGGDSSFIRDVTQFLDEEMRPIFDELNWKENAEKFKKVQSLNVRRVYTADAFSSGFLILGTYVFTKFSDKIFEFIFAERMRGRFNTIMRKILDKVWPLKKKSIVYQNLAYISDMDVSIVIRTVLNCESDLEAVFEDMKKVSIVAYEWLISNGKKANIHCYTIKDGRYPLVPSLFNSIEEVK